MTQVGRGGEIHDPPRGSPRPVEHIRLFERAKRAARTKSAAGGEIHDPPRGSPRTVEHIRLFERAKRAARTKSAAGGLIKLGAPGRIGLVDRLLEHRARLLD